jgi:hypothetical protein
LNWEFWILNSFSFPVSAFSSRCAGRGEREDEARAGGGGGVIGLSACGKSGGKFIRVKNSKRWVQGKSNLAG